MDEREAIAAPRYTSFMAHPCGCRTHWNVDLWRSEATERCPEHAAHEAAHLGGPGQGGETDDQ